MESKGIPASDLGGLGRRGVAGPETSLPSGLSRQQLTAALRACRADLPRGGGFGGAANPQVTAYRNCLIVHGDTSPGRFGAGPGRATTTTLPGVTTTTVPAATIAAAQAACAALRPTFGPGGGAAPGVPPSPSTPSPSATVAS